jgi:SAM-dependent methyltransferase
MNVLLDHITRLLADQHVLAAYDQVAELYPYAPSLSLWRAWEYAAYRTHALQEPVLDVGCGDGQWFRLVWPEIGDVSGIDLEPAAVERARRSGVYRQVWQADAAAMPVAAGAFGSVFANCSLEHMDNIETVIGNVYRALRPGGTFIFSVVTDKIDTWFSPTVLAEALGAEARARDRYEEWLAYHHLVNLLPIECWCEALISAGFEIVEHIPIIPEMTGRLFLLLDGLWHTRQGAGELSDRLQPYLQGLPNFPAAFRGILQSALLLETNRRVGCGAVLVARKVEPNGGDGA